MIQVLALALCLLTTQMTYTHAASQEQMQEVANELEFLEDETEIDLDDLNAYDEENPISFADKIKIALAVLTIQAKEFEKQASAHVTKHNKKYIVAALGTGIIIGYMIANKLNSKNPQTI